MSGSLESVQSYVHVHRQNLGLCSHLKESGVRTCRNPKREREREKKKTSSAAGGLNTQCFVKQNSEPKALPTNLLWPPLHGNS